MSDLPHRLNRWELEAEVLRLRASQTRTREGLALLGAEVARLEEENSHLRAEVARLEEENRKLRSRPHDRTL
jgi:predicted RNase H-like nuclease (RuvC/YqgF family)